MAKRNSHWTYPRGWRLRDNSIGAVTPYLNELLKGPVVSILHLWREETGWQLSPSQMILDALTAIALF